MTTKAYISLGSNQGDRKAMLAKALWAIDGLPGVSVEEVSHAYETEPQGDREQAWFMNQVALLICDVTATPSYLLSSLLAIELALGRRRNASRRFGPRPVDLDLLLFGQVQMETDTLILPHPRMAERAFVLVPLLEIAPDIALPDGRSAAECLGKLSYHMEGRKIYQS